MLDHIAAVKSLGLPQGSFIVVGGSCLAVRGIRESNDIDIVVTPELFDALKQQGWGIDQDFFKKWGRERVVRRPFEVIVDMVIEKENRRITSIEAIAGAELIDDIPFLPLETLLFFKRDTSRPKDLADIELIEKYLEKRP